MRALLMVTLVAATFVGCGESKSDKKGITNSAPGPTPTASPSGSPVVSPTPLPTGTPVPPPPSPGPTMAPTWQPIPSGEPTASPSDPLVGAYEQVENRQSKFRIDDLHLVNTNIQIPVLGSVSGQRVSPQFPHHLVFDVQKNYWRTIGYYNASNRDWENVELRLTNYGGGQLLDVTFVLHERGPRCGQQQPQEQWFQQRSDMQSNYRCGGCGCRPCPPPPPPPCSCETDKCHEKLIPYRFEREGAQQQQQQEQQPEQQQQPPQVQR